MGHGGVARVRFLEITGDPLRWQRLGFTVDAAGVIWFLETSLRFESGSGRPESNRADETSSSDPDGQLVGWVLSDLFGDDDDTADVVDGLRTSVAQPEAPWIVEHHNGAVGIDHVVVLTGSIERTSDAIERATGAPLKRIRELADMRQGFHRIGAGGLIVELVERRELSDLQSARWWGFVVTVADLDSAVASIGADLIGLPKPAVQPGRRIATVRREAGIGVPLAFMSA